MRALVADDDENMRELMSTVLTSVGCACTVCADGAAAMLALEREPVDLIVSDIVMPHHNGYELFTRMVDSDLVPLSPETRVTNASNNSIDPVARFGPDYASVILGGSGVDQAWDLAIDPQGNTFVVGTTVSRNFPVRNLDLSTNAPPTLSPWCNHGRRGAHREGARIAALQPPAGP